MSFVRCMASTVKFWKPACQLFMKRSRLNIYYACGPSQASTFYRPFFILPHLSLCHPAPTLATRSNYTCLSPREANAMHKSLKRVAGLALGLLSLIVAPGLRAQSLAGPQCSNPDGSLLWEVKGPALERNGGSLYLFGSIHVGKPEFYPLPPRLEALVQGADALVFEVNPEVVAEPRIAMQLQLRGMLPAGQTLDQLVPPATLTELERVLASLGLPLRNFANYKPWMLAVLLANVQVTQLGFNPQWGLESYLLQRRRPGTPILELESWEQQLDMLESIDPALFLDYSLEEFEAGADLLDDLIAGWLCGDREALVDTLLSTSLSQDDGFYEAMFVNRNRVMAEGISRLANAGDQDWLVVVGAAHLLGEDSVVSLLQDEGFRVTPVPLQAQAGARVP